MTVLAPDALQHAEIELGLRRLDRDLIDRAVGERLQERVAAPALVVHELRVAEAHVQRRSVPARRPSARSIALSA